MTANPIKLYRRWSARRQERRDMRLRLRCLELSAQYGGALDICHKRAYLAWLFVKYGVNKDGRPLREIFRPEDPRLPNYEGPLNDTY